MTRKALDNFRERLQECVINNGRHLSVVIFKSIWKEIASYVLFISERIFCVPCFVWFLLTFKMWELFLPHPVALAIGNKIKGFWNNPSSISTIHNDIHLPLQCQQTNSSKRNIGIWNSKYTIHNTHICWPVCTVHNPRCSVLLVTRSLNKLIQYGLWTMQC